MALFASCCGCRLLETIAVLVYQIYISCCSRTTAEKNEEVILKFIIKIIIMGILFSLFFAYTNVLSIFIALVASNTTERVCTNTV